MGGSGDFQSLFEDSLEPDPRTRRWPWWVAGALIVVVAGFFVVADGDDTVPLDSTTTALSAAQSDTTTSQPPAVVSSITSPVDDEPASLPVRFHSAMVAVPDFGSIVLYGGREGSRSEPVAGGWVLTDGSWSALTGTFEPSPREFSRMEYIPGLGQLMLVGGTPNPILGCRLLLGARDAAVDVWTLDVTDWSWDWLRVAEAPPNRWGHATAFDPGLGELVLFGGTSEEAGRLGAALLGDTWIFDPASSGWMSIDSEVAPAPRTCHGMTYDPGSGVVLLWGGQTDASEGDSSVWVFETEAAAWTEVVTEGGPSPRWLHGMVYEPTTGEVFVIGGFGRITLATESGSTTTLTFTDEVWAFDPVAMTWREAARLPFPTGASNAVADGQGQILFVEGGAVLVYDVALDAWEMVESGTGG